MPTTLVLLKPDTVRHHRIGTVLARFEAAGLSIRACKLTRLSPELLREHYAHIASRPFYPEVEAFMRSAPVLAVVLEGDDAVDRVRALIGVTDSRQAAPGTLRAEFGTDQMVNVAHASDTAENAALEIARFFAPAELFTD